MRKVKPLAVIKAKAHVASGKAWGMAQMIGNLPGNRMGRRIKKKLVNKTTK